MATGTGKLTDLKCKSATPGKHFDGAADLDPAFIDAAGVSPAKSCGARVGRKPRRVRIAARQHSLREGGEGSDAKAVADAKRNQLVLDTTIEKVVGRLFDDIARDASCFAHHQAFHHLPGRVARGPDVANLPLPDEVVERAERLVLRNIE